VYAEAILEEDVRWSCNFKKPNCLHRLTDLGAFLAWKNHITMLTKTGVPRSAVCHIRAITVRIECGTGGFSDLAEARGAAESQDFSPDEEDTLLLEQHAADHAFPASTHSAFTQDVHVIRNFSSSTPVPYA